MRSNVGRIMFWFLLLGGLLVLLSADEPITLDVSPKVAIANPHKSQTFRVLVRVAEHPDNKVVSLSGDCGGSAFASQFPSDQLAYTKYYEMVVTEPCVFVACVFRSKAKFCDKRTVAIPDQPP